jgi:hypothetical protein
MAVSVLGILLCLEDEENSFLLDTDAHVVIF